MRRLCSLFTNLFLNVGRHIVCWNFFMAITLVGTLGLVLISGETGLGAEARVGNEICPSIYLSPGTHLSFSRNERRFICGFDQSAPWKEIPFNQVKFLLKPFLQDQGYHEPSFTLEDDKLIVDPGKKFLVEKVTKEGFSKPFPNLVKRRFLEGVVLTPSYLDELESWGVFELQKNSYPCARVNTRALIPSGEVSMQIQSGSLIPYPEIQRQEIDDLSLGVLDRFYAFHPGDSYNAILNQLTTQRMEEDGIVQTAHLISKCKDERSSLNLREEIIPGEPRVFRFGVGADTEGLVLTRTNFTVHRLNSLGTKYEIDLYASFLEQRIKTGFDWFFLRPPSRLYLRPEFSLAHQKEDQFETFTASVSMGPYVSWDHSWGRGLFGLVPDWSRIQTFEGAQKGVTTFLSGILKLSLMSHQYEYYRASPQTGYAFEFHARFSRRGLFSDVTAQRLSFSGEHLWNVASLSPPLLVLGMRYRLRTTIADRNDPNFLRLPPQFVHYLGGSQDLRGFGRNELPLEVNPNRTGSLSSAYLGFEARFVEILPFSIEPFLFADFGASGNEQFDLNKPIFWNPGIGLRWESPIGVLRGTYAHGFMIGNRDPANDTLTHHQFYFSFGEEF